MVGSGTLGPGQYETERLDCLSGNLEAKNSIHYNFMSESASTKSTATGKRPTSKKLMLNYFVKNKASTSSSWFNLEKNSSVVGGIDIGTPEPTRPSTSHCVTRQGRTSPGQFLQIQEYNIEETLIDEPVVEEAKKSRDNKVKKT